MNWCLRIICVLITSAASCVLISTLATVVRAGAELGRNRVEYVAPKDAKHQSLYELLRERRALEQLQRLFSPLRLPSELTFQITECDGVANAWYERWKMTICCGLLELIGKPMPKDVTWAGITIPRFSLKL